MPPGTKRIERKVGSSGKYKKVVASVIRGGGSKILTRYQTGIAPFPLLNRSENSEEEEAEFTLYLEIMTN